MSCCAGGLDELQRDGREGCVASELRQGDEEEEAPERFAHDAGGDGERVADEGRPAEEQGPSPIAAIPAGGALQRGGVRRKPAAVAEAERRAAQHIIDERTQHIADAGDEDEQDRRMAARDEQARQHGFRLGGQQRRRDESREEQGGVGR